ncbi:hypothetical protein E3P96_01542 [Wallemia ichthyophaga]|nr:hypothetical protein E3P96_01542 [Wallemia ichthyophaga]
MGSLTKLPSELWSCVLEQLEPRDQSSSTAALMIAFPKAPVDFKHVWTHIHLRNELQVKALNLKLVNDKEMKISLQREPFLGQSLRHSALLGDPYYLINVYEVLKQAHLLSLFVGPAFAPEHLAELFRKPRRNLKTLNIHFRPYLKRRSYYQFLKGAYFDSTLEELARRWPINANLTRVSFIQDNPPSIEYKASKERLPIEEEESVELVDHSTYLNSYSGGPSTMFRNKLLTEDLPKKFAHPIVFFNLSHCLTQFASSDFASSVEHFRLRVPQRDVATSLSVQGSLPHVTSLDLSTTTIRVGGPDANLASLLRRLSKLQYLVLDQTDVLGADRKFINLVARDRAKKAARAIGQLCATTGLVRAKLLQARINEWVAEQRATFVGMNEAMMRQVNIQDIQENQGRRDQIPEQSTSSRRRINTGRRAFQANFSLREQTETGSAPRLSSAARAYLKHAPVEYVVLAELPCLKAITVGVRDCVKQARRDEWQRDFEKGWKEGCSKVVESITSSYRGWIKSREDEDRARDLRERREGREGRETDSHRDRGKQQQKYKKYGKSSNNVSQNRRDRGEERRKKVELIRIDEEGDIVTSEDRIRGSTLPNGFAEEFQGMRACLSEEEVLKMISRGSDKMFQVPKFCSVGKCEHPAEMNDSDSDEDEDDDDDNDVDDVDDVMGCPRGCAHEYIRRVWSDI